MPFKEGQSENINDPKGRFEQMLENLGDKAKGNPEVLHGLNLLMEALEARSLTTMDEDSATQGQFAKFLETAARAVAVGGTVSSREGNTGEAIDFSNWERAESEPPKDKEFSRKYNGPRVRKKTTPPPLPPSRRGEK